LDGDLPLPLEFERVRFAFFGIGPELPAYQLFDDIFIIGSVEDNIVVLSLRIEELCFRFCTPGYKD
jgi:hypothetical protein